jgi:Restriction endonuclease
MSKSSLINRYQDLKTKIARGKNLTEQQRGYQLEKLLYDLFEYEILNPIPAYKGKGEQIDGLFEYKNRFFLLEAKWESKPLAASNVRNFQSLVKSRLFGTLGVFISMSDFAYDTPSLIEKLSVNVILFTQKDMDYCFDSNHSFSQILDIKLHYAAKDAVVLYEFENYFKSKKNIKK